EKQLNAPIEYKESFKVIGRDKVISSELAYRIADSAGLRNLLVHHYDEIDLDRFYDGLKGGIADYEQYIKEVNQYINK
ncbi:MAG: hypothetical protein UR93_C0011G0001, partial [Berkelbacteria bacterium GW2011_GWA2_35_9]